MNFHDSTEKTDINLFLNKYTDKATKENKMPTYIEAIDYIGNQFYLL